MLLQRSILSKVCLLLVVCLVKAQYEYDDKEKNKVKEEHDDTNYAKIFELETAAALTAAKVEDNPDDSEKNDYVAPVDFENYFKPAHIFGESNEQAVKAKPEKKKKEPLEGFESKKEHYGSYFDDGAIKDYYSDDSEKDQKLQKEQSNKDEEVIPPGPSYISHQIPAYNYENDEDKSTSASEDIERSPSKKSNQKSSQGANFEEGRVEKEEDDYKLPAFSFDPIFKNNKQKVDHDTGKSSSTVSQHPSASGYTKPKSAASTPYEKYSFQPKEKEVDEYAKTKPAASTSYEKYNFQPEEKEVDEYSKTKPAASTSYEKYNFQPEEKEVDEYSKTKPAASTSYEKYNFQPKEKEVDEYSKTKPAASTSYEKYNFQPDDKEVDGYAKTKAAASTPYKEYNFQPEEKEVDLYAKTKEAASTPYKHYSFQPEEKQVDDYDKPKPAASTPYKNYKFQPVEKEVDEYSAQNSKFFDSIIIGTDAPYHPEYKKNSEPKYEPKYEPQSTEDSPSQLQGKGCRKVSSNSDDMNCFVCENPKTNAKYTQCSYSSQKKPLDYYEGNSAKYSMAHKEAPSTYRYKRYADNEENDPYTYIRNRARKASELGIPSDFNSGFQYEPEHYDESKPELTFSEQNSEEIKKNPENCQKVDREGMTCTVCKDPKSGGNFEQCSYTSKPKEKKYAYVTEKKFDNDEPVETKVVSQSKAAESNEKEKGADASKVNTEFLEEYQGKINQEKSPKKRNEGRDYDAKSSDRKTVDIPNYEHPSDYVSSFSSPSYTDSVFKGSSSDHSENIDKKGKSEGFSDFDEYHFKYFPEFAKQESRQEPVQESYEIPAPQATKQNVETVLAEFTKKDRSNCKKAEKKGMTCYLCVDKNNIQNEECMYVQESKPENKHVAYHESKATDSATQKATDKSTDKATENSKVPESEKNKTEESKQETKQETKQEIKQEVKQDNKQDDKEDSKQEATAAESKYYFLSVPSPVGMETAASEQVESVVRYNPDHGKKKKRSHKAREPKTDASAYDSERINDKTDPTIKTPEEFNVAPGEGVYSDETKAVYSKELGVQLPKYMLDKSEFEKEFDAFAGAF